MTTPMGEAALAQQTPSATSETFTACFSVVARTDPHTLSRVLEPFTKRGLTPSHVYAVRSGRGGESLSIDVHLADADADTQRRLANDMRAVWLVETVLTSDKGRAE